MEKLKNLITSIKNNWRAMLFAAAYVVCFFAMIALSFNLTEYVKGTDYAIFSPLLLCAALLSVLSLIAKPILYFLFKEEASQVAKKSSIVLIPVGIFVTIWTLFNFSSEVPIPLDNQSELGIVISIFAVPAYFIFLIVTGMFLLLVSFIAFALLRFVMAHPRAVIIVFFISSILWFISLGNI